MEPRSPRIIPHGEPTRKIVVVGDVYSFLATSSETNGRYTTWEAFVPPGGGPPLHIHSREEESFYVIEGEITLFMGDETQIARPGTFVHLPTGTPHGFRNLSSEPVRMLISVAPAGLEEMFFEVGTPYEPGVAPQPPGEEEITRLVEVAARYGIEILPPSADGAPPNNAT